MHKAACWNPLVANDAVLKNDKLRAHQATPQPWLLRLHLQIPTLLHTFTHAALRTALAELAARLPTVPEACRIYAEPLKTRTFLFTLRGLKCSAFNENARLCKSRRYNRSPYVKLLFCARPRCQGCQKDRKCLPNLLDVEV